MTVGAMIAAIAATTAAATELACIDEGGLRSAFFTAPGPGFSRSGVAACGIMCVIADDLQHAMNEDRLIDLETRFAYQEETLRVLNEVVTRQQQQIERLELTCRQLLERVERVGDGGVKGSLQDEVPPHY